MTNYELIYPDGWNDRWEMEAESKGYLSVLVVRVGANIYPVFFIDKVRVIQDFESEKTQGYNFFTEKNLIILESVTISEVRVCLNQIDETFFT